MLFSSWSVISWILTDLSAMSIVCLATLVLSGFAECCARPSHRRAPIQTRPGWLDLPQLELEAFLDEYNSKKIEMKESDRYVLIKNPHSDACEHVYMLGEALN